MFVVWFCAGITGVHAARIVKISKSVVFFMLFPFFLFVF
jgi:hypothetical protein